MVQASRIIYGKPSQSHTLNLQNSHGPLYNRKEELKKQIADMEEENVIEESPLCDKI